MLDNFLAEIIGMGEMERGVTEFFRELPGILLIFFLAAFYLLSAETMYKAGAVFLLIGMAMHAISPPTKVFAMLAICTYSIGEHIQIGMKSTLSLQYAKPDFGGAALGAQNAVNQLGTLAGSLLIVFVFSLFAATQPYTVFFCLATVLAGVSVACSMRITGKSEMDKAKRRFYFHRKYTKYYMLEGSIPNSV